MLLQGDEFFSLQVGVSSTRMYSEGTSISGVNDTDDGQRVRVIASRCVRTSCLCNVTSTLFQ